MKPIHRQFCKHTVLIGDNENATFDDDQQVIFCSCSECKNLLKIEYGFIRALAGKLLGRLRKRK